MTHGKSISLLVLLLSVAFSVPAFAEIKIIKVADPAIPASDQLFKGTIVLTAPDGSISILEPTEPVPAIKPGSVLEVFDGYFSVETGDGEQVTISVLGNEFTLANGASATVIANQTEGKVIVRKGFASYSTPAGQANTIQAPQSFPVVLGQPLKALPTAEGGTQGFETSTEAVPDSRNIDASPST